MKGRLRKMLLAPVIILVILALGIGLYLQHPKFGTLPEGARLERIKSSPHYADGQFQNLVPIPPRVEGSSSVSLWLEYLFIPKERLAPTEPIPSVKTDLMALDRDKDIVVWLGHSSYYMQLGGKRILIDPVFSSYAAPVSFVNKAFAGTNPYTAEDMPEIDYLLITHDHWDHLDYPTISALKPKIKQVICGLGVGAYFEQWGFAADLIHEADWFTAVELENDFTVHVLPARHFSGRMLTRNKTLWTSLALVTPERRIFFSGDSGYGPHFKQIGESLNGFDLVVLDNGQYDKNWPHVHMTPEEAVQAAEDLKAQALLPAHVGKFAIANHPWDEPFQRITAASQNKNYRLFTPMIGEPVELANEQQVFSPWWERMN
ncbi:MBL fold metallo-hydrolase [Sporomusa sp.]|jgi:L-ascorbate metabolism protein UlaG (beta-lactamase superfamily)|uniref:MBL fold metallo-hydrolase n=1 Tax=Sporomusa sp. TaxID=2078658 RepID=UPI002C2331BC|nr:MBL fold metallo-hydrolase [Sporomusa sp.]HWR05690.1 MBL fold metallo-hydrolase [Sporomusa sp.]